MRIVRLVAFLLFCLLPFAVTAAPVDINSASAEEIAASLTGVGPQKAAAIVAYRDTHGPFASALD